MCSYSACKNLLCSPPAKEKKKKLATSAFLYCVYFECSFSPSLPLPSLCLFLFSFPFFSSFFSPYSLLTFLCPSLSPAFLSPSPSLFSSEGRGDSSLWGLGGWGGWHNRRKLTSSPEPILEVFLKLRNGLLW